MTKRAAMLALVSGCYVGAHGSVDATLRSREVTKAAPQGALDVGGGAADENQSFALFVSVGKSPLVERDASLVRSTTLSFGGRYEHAVTASHSSLRWYGRLLMGGSTCTGSEEGKAPECMSAEAQRSVGVYSLGFGVALVAVGDQRNRHELTPAFASMGLGLVYTYATDERLGSGDFLGLELSFGAGGDVIMPFANAGH